MAGTSDRAALARARVAERLKQDQLDRELSSKRRKAVIAPLSVLILLLVGAFGFMEIDMDFSLETIAERAHAHVAAVTPQTLGEVQQLQEQEQIQVTLQEDKEEEAAEFVVQEQEQQVAVEHLQQAAVEQFEQAAVEQVQQAAATEQSNSTENQQEESEEAEPAPAVPIKRTITRPANAGCTITKEDIEYTLDRIMSTPTITDPYPYLFVEDVFTDELYSCMLSKLPKKNNLYEPLQAGLKRYVLTLSNAKTKKPGKGKPDPKYDPKFWSKWVDAFGGDALKLAYLGKFNSTLSLRDMPPGTSASTYHKRMFWKIKLSRDMEGYAIGPHTDSNDKWVTALYYLPKDKKNIDSAGTCVVRSKSGKVQLANSDWEKWSDPDFDVVFQAPFVPNSVFVFAPCFGSWHAVKQIDVPFERNTIQSFIMGKDKVRKKHCPGHPDPNANSNAK